MKHKREIDLAYEDWVRRIGDEGSRVVFCATDINDNIIHTEEDYLAAISWLAKEVFERGRTDLNIQPTYQSKI